MKNKRNYYGLALVGFKAMYIILILSALWVLCLAMHKDLPGYSYVNEELLRPICDDILLCNFFLLGANALFLRLFWLCAKSQISIHGFCEYSHLLWIIFCQPLFRKKFKFYTLDFRQMLNNPQYFSTFPHPFTLKSWKDLRKIKSFSHFPLSYQQVWVSFSPIRAWIFILDEYLTKLSTLHKFY